MAIRILSVVLALSMVIATGCRSRSNYQPAVAPAVVAVQPVHSASPSCPQGQPGLPTPPPAGLLIPAK
jgi:hypothetical protein